MEIPIKKNETYTVEIIDNGFEGEGIAKIENFTIFIPQAIKGEIVRIVIVKVLSSHAFGKIIEITKKSPYRIENDCETYQRCGGCNLRHIQYNYTLIMKQNAVQSLVNKTLKEKIQVEETLGMEHPYHYRNKTQYPVGTNEEGKPIIGVYANRTHKIIPIKQCRIGQPEAEEIAKWIMRYWDEHKLTVYQETTGKGLLRHIVIKKGWKTQEIMCILVINGKQIPKEDELANKLKKQFPKIKTIVKNINTKNTNVILGTENINLWGEGIIHDQLGDYTFTISPLSFYQVNPEQAEKLYKIGVEEAKITNKDNVFDLYCGIGTISLFLAKKAKKVYGIEIVEEAIKMAKQNAKQNEIGNTEFIAGDVEKVLAELIEVRKIIPDVVMVDPPRKGLDERSINNLLKIEAKRVVYISCNPATLVRDLAKLEDKYRVVKVKPVDMFPFTSHVECCSVLYLKGSIQ